jgi:hypothetical protein
MTSRCLLATALAATMALAGAGATQASPPASSSGSDQPAGKHCVEAEEATIRPAGDSGGAMRFSSAFYRRTYVLDVSLDGEEGNEFPISIETVCAVPKARRKEAAQLAGSDGVARILNRTRVWEGARLLTGPPSRTALGAADTASMRVRLARPRTWSEDEDGNPVPTFRAGRIEITD